MLKERYHTEDLSHFSFLITGGAGFIGSNLVEYLLLNNAKTVRVLDNFSTGFRTNLKEFEDHPAFDLVHGDIRDLSTCIEAAQNIDFVSHQAALGSVPRSIKDPATTNAVNITGFLNMLLSVKESDSVKRMVYAASSSTYGDSEKLPKQEERIGKPLSPYAVTKYANELYAEVFGKIYNMDLIGLRYFNVFGPRQSPDGPYAAVIPLFLEAIKTNTPPIIHGDGFQTRDFTYIENAVQANIKAFFAPDTARNQVFNVACGESISINGLWEILRTASNSKLDPVYGPERTGDVKNSLADVSKAEKELDYGQKILVKQGLELTLEWYIERSTI